jgi:hypothetical protein
LADYLDFGVPNIWMIDRGPRRAWRATRAGFEEIRVALADSAIAVPLDELFDSLDLKRLLHRS